MRSTFLYSCCIGITLIAGCVKLFNPVAPSWDVTLNLPVVNHTYTIQDIIQNNPSLFSTDRNGIFLYSTTAVVKPVRVENSLTITDDSFSFGLGIGAFSIKNASSVSNAITLGRMIPDFGPINGTVTVIPQTPFQFQAQPMPPITEFRQVTVAGGTLTVEIRNNLPTAINQLTLVFFDQFRGQYGDIVTATFSNPIQPGGLDSRSFPLSERTIGNNISFDAIGVLGSSPTPVQIDTSANLSVGLRLTDVTVMKAEARIPQVLRTRSDVVQLNDSSSIDSAEIKSGLLSMKAKIPFNGSGAVTVEIPNLTSQFGKPFRHEFNIVKKQSGIDTTFVLDGYILSAPQREISYRIDTRIDDSGDDYVLLDGSDSVTGTIAISKITLKSFKGVVKPTDIPIQRNFLLNTKAINKLISGTVRYTDASLIINLQTPPEGFEYDIYGSVVGRNRRTGKTNSLSLPAGGRHYNPGVDSIVFAAPDLVNFLNGFSPNLPDSLSLNMTAQINPTGTRQGTVHDSDAISGLVHFELPFRLSIKGGVYEDTLSFDISGNGKNINSARLNIDLENSLPTALGIDTLKFLDKAGHSLFSLPKQGQPPIFVQSGTVTGEIVTQPAKSTTYIELTHSETSLLDSSKNIVMYMRLETPTTEAVRFRSTDSIKVKITSTMNYRASP